MRVALKEYFYVYCASITTLLKLNFTSNWFYSDMTNKFRQELPPTNKASITYSGVVTSSPPPTQDNTNTSVCYTGILKRNIVTNAALETYPSRCLLKKKTFSNRIPLAKMNRNICLSRFFGKSSRPLYEDLGVIGNYEIMVFF